MADTIYSYSNLPLGIIMHHLQVELIAVPTPLFMRKYVSQKNESRESFSQYQLFATQMYIKS